ncbi:MAG TPA: ABC transporter ATP-binding protein [Gemmataceae bacterium]|nr:ABC transporter ATP-binding protein [Gemmataceae bacterium]
MERQGFDRALEFFRHARMASWIAVVFSLVTAVLFVALLTILSLFADLVVQRGEVPCLAQLPLAAHDAAIADLELPDDPDLKKDAIRNQVAELRELNVADARLDKLVAADNPEQLSVHDKELRLSALWMLAVCANLDEHVGPDAGDAVRAKVREKVGAFGAEVAFNRDVENLGILGLVVRTRNSLRHWVTQPIAREFPWTWKYGNYRYLEGLLGIALALAAIRAVCSFLANIAAARAVLEVVTRLRRALYLQTYRRGALAFRALGPNEAVRISTRDLEAVHEGLFLRLTTALREPAKFLLVLLFALLVDFWLALAFFLFAGIVWLVGGQMAAHFRRKIRADQTRTGSQLTLIQESLMLMRLAKLYLMEAFNQTRFEKQLASYATAQRRRHRSEAIYRPLFTLLALVAVFGLMYLGAHLLLNGTMGVAGAMTMTTALVSLYWPASIWMDERRSMRKARESAKTLFDFLDRPGSVAQSVEAEFLPSLSKSLEFDKVVLKEPDSGRALLRGVSFGIRAGQRVAIVGRDEVEKHAIVYLLSRFLDPNQGEIRIDKKNIRWVTLDSLRVQIAIVLQHNQVFHGTVAENIGCGEQSFNRARIVEAAKIAHVHHFVQKLPKGYDTVIGEMGHALKPGEMFRIGLARAILRDPPLLVIEEPDVPLDDDTKALIDDTFQRVLPGRTVLFLPHRLSTIKSCDRVFVLHEGRIVDQGEHSNLIRSNDLYRHIQYLEFNEFDGMAAALPLES